MAAPTKLEYFNPNYALNITGTDVDAGNNDYEINYNVAGLKNGLSICTGTLTAMTVTIHAKNMDTLVDITTALFGVSSLASDSAYIADIPLPVDRVVVRAVRTNATNAVDLSLFAPKR